MMPARWSAKEDEDEVIRSTTTGRHGFSKAASIFSMTVLLRLMRGPVGSVANSFA
jgi:hypothetical protein